MGQVVPKSLSSLTEPQVRIVKQPVQNRFVKLDILDDKFEEIWSIEGVALSGSININAQSDVRRNASLEIVAIDPKLDTKPGNAIWLDRYIKLQVGIEDLRASTPQEKIVWNNCGIYLIDAPSYNYDPKTNTLNISLMDMMCKMTGVRNGYVPGTGVTYKAGESIKQAIIDTLTKFTSFTNYSVANPPAPGVIPNDLEFGQGTTVYDILKALADIYPDYEIFFDVDGNFIYQPIPTGANEQSLFGDDIWKYVVLSEELNTSFQDVKNSIEVFGRSHNPSYYDDKPEVEYIDNPTSETEEKVNAKARVTIPDDGDHNETPEIPPDIDPPEVPKPSLPSNSYIYMKIPDVTAYEDGQIYGFTLTVEKGKPIINPTVQINEIGYYSLRKDGGGDLTIEDNGEETYYVIEWVESEKYFRWLGHLQAYGFAEDTDPNSPFNITAIGRIPLPLYDGDYANCITDDLAQQRAEYELWLHTNMNNSVQLNIIPIYWLDVNILVEYTLMRNWTPDSNPVKYLIKSIQLGLAPTDQGSIEMIQYYGREQTTTDNTTN